MEDQYLLIPCRKILHEKDISECTIGKRKIEICRGSKRRVISATNFDMFYEIDTLLTVEIL